MQGQENLYTCIENTTFPSKGSLWDVPRSFIDIHSPTYISSHPQIGSLEFFRGENYQSFFKHIDMSGGFFYERWWVLPFNSTYFPP